MEPWVESDPTRLRSGYLSSISYSIFFSSEIFGFLNFTLFPTMAHPRCMGKMLRYFQSQRLFEGNLRLSPNSNYGQPDPQKDLPRICVLYYRKGPNELYYEIEVFVDILLAEYCLREIVQREQLLKSKILLAERNGNKAAGCHDELVQLLRQYSKAEYDLYVAESRLPVGPVHKSYHTLRQNPVWFLCPELVEDCKARGGCCGRTCGCCQTRHKRTTRPKGFGHCTPSCECCINERRFEYSPEELQSFAVDFKNQLQDDNPAYIVLMANSSFLLPLVTEGEKPAGRIEEQRGHVTQRKGIFKRR
ncbi:unnamed protein product [Penicillium salamii]|nr:unnamed protein product [Penicillium salamii]